MDWTHVRGFGITTWKKSSRKAPRNFLFRDLFNTLLDFLCMVYEKLQWLSKEQVQCSVCRFIFCMYVVMLLFLPKQEQLLTQLSIGGNFSVNFIKIYLFFLKTYSFSCKKMDYSWFAFWKLSENSFIPNHLYQSVFLVNQCSVLKL